MEVKPNQPSDSVKTPAVEEKSEYKESVRKQLNSEVKKIIDLEMQKAAQELIEEHKKATRQVVEEYKAAINMIVQEEKAEIWKKAEDFKKSILQLGL